MYLSFLLLLQSLSLHFLFSSILLSPPLFLLAYGLRKRRAPSSLAFLSFYHFLGSFHLESFFFFVFEKAPNSETPFLFFRLFGL